MTASILLYYQVLWLSPTSTCVLCNTYNNLNTVESSTLYHLPYLLRYIRISFGCLT